MTVIRHIKPSELGRYEIALARRFPAMTKMALKQAGDSGIGVLRRASANIRDTGKFQNGWMAIHSELDLHFRNREPYEVNVERGRGANKRMPPTQVILEWCQRHGIDERRVFAIRRAIGIRGIAPRPVLTSEAIRSELQDIMLARLRFNWAATLEKVASHG